MIDRMPAPDYRHLTDWTTHGSDLYFAYDKWAGGAVDEYLAQRIAACLRACAGIPTEQLGKGNVAALIKSLSDITQDMDEDSDSTCETLWEEVTAARAALTPFKGTEPCE